MFTLIAYRVWRIALRTALLAVLALFSVVSGRAADVLTLRVGTSGDYAPFSSRDTAGNVTGFDISVARRFAADLGRPVEFVPFRWPDLVGQLEAGAFDIAMSGITIRPDRAVHLLYSRPYVVTGAVAVIRKRERRKFGGLSDLDRPVVRVGVNAGGHLEQVARRRFAHGRLIAVADNRRLPDLLERGEIDAAVSEELEARTWPAQHFEVLGPFTRDRKAYALPLGASDLLRQLNEWLAAREADGWLNQQRRQWFSERAVLTPEQAGFEALVAAIDRRLQLMPLVAAVKRRDHLPVDDPTQEARVLERVRGAAVAAQLNADDVAALFRVQIEAAKAVEHAAAATEAPADLSLAQLRTAVGAASDQIIAELTHCQPWMREPARHQRLEAALHDGLTGVSPGVMTKLRRSIERVRRTPSLNAPPS